MGRTQNAAATYSRVSLPEIDHPAVARSSRRVAQAPDRGPVPRFFADSCSFCASFRAGTAVAFPVPFIAKEKRHGEQDATLCEAVGAALR